MAAQLCLLRLWAVVVAAEDLDLRKVLLLDPIRSFPQRPLERLRILRLRHSHRKRVRALRLLLLHSRQAAHPIRLFPRFLPPNPRSPIRLPRRPRRSAWQEVQRTVAALRRKAGLREQPRSQTWCTRSRRQSRPRCPKRLLPTSSRLQHTPPSANANPRLPGEFSMKGNDDLAVATFGCRRSL